MPTARSRASAATGGSGNSSANAQQPAAGPTSTQLINERAHILGLQLQAAALAARIQHAVASYGSPSLHQQLRELLQRGVLSADATAARSEVAYLQALLERFSALAAEHVRHWLEQAGEAVLRGRTTLVDVVVQFAMGGVTVEPGAHLVLGPGTRVAGGATAGVQVAAGGCAELLGPGCEDLGGVELMVNRRTASRHFHAVQLAARQLQEGFASPGVDWTTHRIRLEANPARPGRSSCVQMRDSVLSSQGHVSCDKPPPDLGVVPSPTGAHAAALGRAGTADATGPGAAAAPA
eukprot:XP_001694954.1 predicted protein [Chlamydomonas reinhardtii]